MISLSSLRVGRQYKKADIVGNVLPALSIVEGELCFFLTERNRDGLINMVVSNGVVFQPRYRCQLVKPRVTVTTQFHVFYRLNPAGPFEYKGKSTGMKRFSSTQNLLVL